jgi:hypothetical protein
LATGKPLQAPEEIHMRRIEIRVNPAVILKAVSQICGGKVAELDRPHSRHPGRRLAMKLLVERGGLSRQKVARQLGLASSAAVSRHLKGSKSSGEIARWRGCWRKC